MFHRVPNTPLDTNLSVFQYKKLYNVLLLNRILIKFAEMEPCCDPVWNAANETPIHLLHESIFFMNPSSSWIHLLHELNIQEFLRVNYLTSLVPLQSYLLLLQWISFSVFLAQTKCTCYWTFFFFYLNYLCLQDQNYW